MQQVQKEEAEALKNYKEACLAAKEFEKEFKCICAASTDRSSDLFIWTHANFIDKVAYYLFQYRFLDVHKSKMVYTDLHSQYVTCIYYE